ncbi:uncharacterized protein [Watersipora subatra]|uniref:uncharacterized protein isoform X3 n=1 Tax=Watersipora subatra TaxID=2589382 RepID=UPI00355B431C
MRMSGERLRERPQTVGAGVNGGSLTFSSNSLAASPSCRTNMNFGKFYQTSYLDKNGNIVKKGSVSTPNLQPPASFHRPDNFSYAKSSAKLKKPKKAGMLDLLRGSSPIRTGERPHSRDTSKSPERPADTEAVIKLSHYPSAEIRKDIPPIEREDWPAPPAIAVITKHLVRNSLAKKYEKDSSDEEEINGIDSKIQKELNGISKIHDSAMVQCIREDVTEQIKQDKKRLLDPRSASRTPSANKEPVQPPRFTSPLNASPSRSLVDRPRFISESAIKQTNTDRPVVHSASASHRYRVKPGYSFGCVSKSLSTAPPGTPGAYIYESFSNYSSDEEEMGIREMERKMHVVDLVTRNGDEDDDRDSVFEDTFVYRNNTRPTAKGKKSPTSSNDISHFDGSPFLNAMSFDYRKRSESVLTLWEELLFEPKEPIPYSELNLSSETRRKGLSNTNLEKYLSANEFMQYLGTSREEFYKLPEYKRNDIKTKAKLL